MNRQELVDKIVENGKHFSLAITGGGTQCISDLLAGGGASSVFLEAIVPYSRESLARYVGFVPTTYVSKSLAKTLAETCFHDNCEYFLDNHGVDFSIGVTAQLRSENEREGRQNKAFIVSKGENGYSTIPIEYDSGNRKQQENDLSYVILDVIYRMGVQK